MSICSASGWATFRTAMLVAFLSFTYRGPHGATHRNYIRFADATSMPGKEVRASVARPSPPFPSPREADPPLPSQTWRKGASNIRQTFAPVCNRQVRKFPNIWRTCCPATVVVVVVVVVVVPGRRAEVLSYVSRKKRPPTCIIAWAPPQRGYSRCVSEKGTVGSTPVAHSGTFGHLRTNLEIPGSESDL